MKLIDRVKELNLPLGKYVVAGGAMEVYGLRPANDIDIVVTPDLFEELRKRGWELCRCEWCQRLQSQGVTKQMLKGDGIDILSEVSTESGWHMDTREVINRAKLIDGVPIIDLRILAEWKRACGRPKDMDDVKLIEEYFIKTTTV